MLAGGAGTETVETLEGDAGIPLVAADEPQDLAFLRFGATP